ncbi:nuclear transport factor 2 family protein [Nocardia alni]|uniref:nuclear transport factor 2 family protein n=1 Tax=Nocardia alni TaxID=2815723 RepID=UPI001C237C68|nr:nuclear transport factor 2 family protein [Nocardia alni]
MSAPTPDRNPLRTEADLIDFLIRYPEQMAFGDDEPGHVMDRWFAPGFTFRNDGLPLERQRLIDHVRPARRNASTLHVDVHEALLSGDRISARYTLAATMRTGATISTEVYLFGRLADDGRISAIDQCTRTVS